VVEIASIFGYPKDLTETALQHIDKSYNKMIEIWGNIPIAEVWKPCSSLTAYRTTGMLTIFTMSL
jgi:hypothetical protein